MKANVHDAWKMENGKFTVEYTKPDGSAFRANSKGNWALSHTEMYLNQFLSKLNRLLFFSEFEVKKNICVAQYFSGVGKE